MSRYGLRELDILISRPATNLDETANSCAERVASSKFALQNVYQTDCRSDAQERE